MTKKKAVSTKSVKEEEGFIVDVETKDNPNPIITDSPAEWEEVTKDNPNPIITDSPAEWEEVTKDEQAAAKTVAKKKGLSSFGSILAAANAKRKERKKKYGKEN